MNTSIQSMNLKPRQAAHRQISDSLRGKITLGEILPGTQLPSTQELAKTWGSHVATVHMGLTQLVSEGLLERTKKGTFVKNIGNRMSTVGVYFGSNIWEMDSKELEYTRQVYRRFKEILCEHGIVEQVFMDKRPPGEQDSKWAPLEKAVNEHAIQGLVILSMHCKHESWLPKMKVPTTGMSNAISCHVSNDMEQFIEAGVQSLIQKGCRSIGLLSPTKKCVRKFYDHFRSVTRNAGVKTDEEWFPAPAGWVQDQERYGYERFKSLWSRQSRPDGILVYTDQVAKGVITSVLQEKVRIPEELHLALHRNREMEYVCPFPVTFIESSCSAVAQKLWEQLQSQLQGKTQEPLKLKFSICENTESSGTGKSSRKNSKYEK